MAMRLLLTSCIATADPSATIQAVLQQYADAEHKEWNMSLSVAFYSPSINSSIITAASGFTNQGLLLSPAAGEAKRAAKPDDIYVWGSTTKMFTGPAVLQLVDKGIIGLDDPISKHIDPLLTKVNGTKLIDHFGDWISEVQVHHLLHMTSGVGDYDREDYSKDQFADPDHDFSPIEILSNYVPKEADFKPGSRQDYCSTNYILLGLILAQHLTTSQSWKDYDQRSVFPTSLAALMPLSLFADEGRCSEHTPVHGIMAPSFYDPGATTDNDVWNVSCVGGWTGGNYLGPVGEVARYTYELYGKPCSVVSKESQALLSNFTAPSSGHHHGSFKFYGMATFSLDWTASTDSVNVTGYGHVGDTYGYQSQSTFFPDRDLVITVATNIESASQKQPAEATCRLYHAIVAAIDGTPAPKCTFTVPHRFIGSCSCE